MIPPCGYGLKCPYRAYSDEGDMLCTYPNLNPEEGEIFPYAEECDCALIEYKSEIYDILLAYLESDEIQHKVRTVAREHYDEVDMMVKEIREKRSKSCQTP